MYRINGDMINCW